MRKKLFFKQSFIASMLLLASNISGNAQPADKSLYQEILKQDSITFTAFNTRNIEQFKKMFTEDLEFFHDKGGLTDYSHTINFIKDVESSNSDLKRELIKETLEIYPIPGYGAMQIGEHRFCHTENNKQDCGTFKFVQIWKKKDDGWKITRVVSYNH
jgi:vesicle coat complex subunit